MSTEMIKLDAPELDIIEDSKAQAIKDIFEPMTEALFAFEGAYAAIIKSADKEITDAVTAEAKRLRIDIGKVRIAAEKLRKEQKDEYLRAGQAIDGVNNILKWAIIDKENKLKGIEDHFAIENKKRLDALQIERATMLAAYVEDAHDRNLAAMEEEVWNAYYAAKKKEFDDRVAAEKQAEIDRIAKEKADAEERKRIEKENARLKKKADERERQAAIEQEEREKAEADRIAIEQEEQKKREKAEAKRVADEKAAQAKRDEVARKEQEKHDEELRIEREKLELIETEIKRREEAERVAAEEAEAKEQAALSMGDKDKVVELVKDLESLKTKYTFKSAKNKKMYSRVSTYLDELILKISDTK